MIVVVRLLSGRQKWEGREFRFPTPWDALDDQTREEAYRRAQRPLLTLEARGGH